MEDSPNSDLAAKQAGIYCFWTLDKSEFTRVPKGHALHNHPCSINLNLEVNVSITQIIARIFFTLISASALTLLGTIVGSVVVNATSKSQMGWDRLADILGWALLSLLIGLIVSAVMAFKLNHSQIVKGIVIAVIGLVVEFGFIYLANVTNLW